MNRTLWLALFLAVAAPAAVSATPEAEHASEDTQLVADRLAAALLPRMRYGSGGYVMHCRHASDGCEARVRRYAAAFAEAGASTRIDPFLLAAVALAESGLNPDAVGPGGERTIMQINPRSPVFPVVWSRCSREGEASCSPIAVHTAARMLVGVQARCGTIERALQAYNTGDCNSTVRYARNVMRVRDRLIATSQEPAAP